MKPVYVLTNGVEMSFKKIFTWEKEGVIAAKNGGYDLWEYDLKTHKKKAIIINGLPASNV